MPRSSRPRCSCEVDSAQSCMRTWSVPKRTNDLARLFGGVVSSSCIMTDLVVRRLLVDMEAPIARHWCAGDAFRTALFNALSMSFPVGEQFFIDAVRGGFKELPPEQQERFRAEVQGFVGQEATHRRLHSLYNAHLEKQGLVNHWGPRAQKRLKLMEGVDIRHWLAITAANEHFTAIFADWMLHNADLL